MEKYHAYLGGAPFKFGVDNRALSWLKTYSMYQCYFGRWIVRFDGYRMIIKHRMRDKHQNANSLSKKTEFYGEEGRVLVFRQRNLRSTSQMKWLDKSGHLTTGHPELQVEKAAESKSLANKDPVPLNLLLRSNLAQRELSRKTKTASHC